MRRVRGAGGLAALVIGVAVGVASAIGAAAPTARAQSLGPDGPKDCVPPIGTNQIVLPLPGVFLPLPSIGGGLLPELDRLPVAAANLGLPGHLNFRDSGQGFNQVVEVVLRDGSLYAKPRGAEYEAAPWRRVPTPPCLDGQIVAVSVDQNMLVALDDQGWMYSLDNLLSGPMLWSWTRSFGGPIWLWPGMGLAGDPASANTWSLSHRMSRSFRDARGIEHPTTAGLVQVVSLTGDGSRIVFQDPWLPADHSYEIGGPAGGRFRSAAIATSESVNFVIGRHGDLYTRKYDLDLAGANHIPGRYDWLDGPVLPSAPDQLRERFDPAFAPISLPAEPWRAQPKIPGEVSSRISVIDTGDRMEDKDLRVEGASGGRTGYWSKPLEGGAWAFTPTDIPLSGMPLAADPGRDQSLEDAAPPTGMDFAGDLPGGWTARTDDFDWAQTTHNVTVISPAGHEYRVLMHTTDGLRLIPRGPGLDGVPRDLEGALDLRPAAPWAPGHEDLADLARTGLGGDLLEIAVRATTGALEVSRPGPFAPRLGLWGRLGTP